ncbi:hypothetical protein [Paenibacillus chungangensis]|uniref:Uncharacterized protein n=1 Tax=Paenibacillus chungangensis TaxID=696535 RepID=A0ABW3HTN1_9BACL
MIATGVTLRKVGVQFEQAGNPWRAFPWPAIGAELLRPDTIKVTFTFNLIYAIGKAAHLEGTLKQIDGQWRFYDFGTLKTEDWQGDDTMPELNGLHIEDELEL